MTVPTIATVATGSKATASWARGAADVLQWVDQDRPITWLVQTSVQNISTGTVVPITFDTEPIDRSSMHSTSSNTSRVNIGLSLGLYLVCGVVAFTNIAAGGSRRAILRLNGSNMPGMYAVTPGVSGVYAAPWVTGIVQASSPSDYVELCGYQDTGSTCSTIASAGLNCALAVIRIGS